MLRHARSKAEEEFAKIKQQGKKVLKEREKARKKIAEKVANLRALRLAREASDKEAAEKGAADETAAKNTKSSQPPKAHGCA